MNRMNCLLRSNSRLLLSLAIFFVTFFCGVKAHDSWRDRLLRQKVTNLSIGASKNDVLRILGAPDTEYHNPHSTPPVSIFFYSSDSFCIPDGCGPVFVAINRDLDRVIMIMITTTGTPPQIIR